MKSSLFSRYTCLVLSLLLTLASLALLSHSPWFWLPTIIFGGLSALGIYDLTQQRHAICRNYPIIGRLRFFFEFIRPEIRQYLLEEDNAQIPFSRTQRTLVYRRAKNEMGDKPFGTQLDVYQTGYECIGHSMRPVEVSDPTSFRVTIGGPDCSQPYSASIFNISAMAPCRPTPFAPSTSARQRAISTTTPAKAVSAVIIAKMAATWSGNWAAATSVAAPPTAILIRNASPSRLKNRR
jgi:glutamate synthase domain-containing protein 2